MSILGKLAWIKARAEMRHCRGLSDVEGTQKAVLHGLLRRHARSRYGQRYGFASIDSARQFGERVPLACYADVEPDIERARREPGVLTCDPVVQWVYTSGTSAAPKVIPHTETSIRNWCRGYARSVYACVTSLTLSDRLFDGEAIYDVAPALVNEIEGVAAGYISGVASQRNRRLRRWQRIPDSIIRIPRYEEKLAALTKWSIGRNITCAAGITSFIYRMLRYVHDHAQDVHENRGCAGPLAAAGGATGRIDLQRLWPHFTLVLSTGVPVDLYRPLLKHLVPRALVRDSYTASEAAYGFSMDEDGGLILNTDLYYFELADPDSRDAAVPLHQGTVGHPYELVVTASNGLWRYRSGDVVRLLALNPARVEVLGRSGNTINVAGEKLVEQQVTAALVAASRATGVSCAGYFFFAWIDRDSFAYCLAMEPDRPVEPLGDFARRFSACLERENYLFRLLRERARTEMHAACLEPGTIDRLLQATEAGHRAAGHAKLRPLTTLQEFCSRVGRERVRQQTLHPGLHEIDLRFPVSVASAEVLA